MLLHLKILGVAALLSISSLCTAAQSGTQTYPTRPARVIVNVSPGGGVDNVARIVAQHYHATWGQPFIVDNRTGAGGSIAAEFVANSAPDGHTLLVGANGPNAVNPSLIKNMPYDTVKDFQPVILALRMLR